MFAYIIISIIPIHPFPPFHSSTFLTKIPSIPPLHSNGWVLVATPVRILIFSVFSISSALCFSLCILCDKAAPVHSLLVRCISIVAVELVVHQLCLCFLCFLLCSSCLVHRERRFPSLVRPRWPIIRSFPLVVCCFCSSFRIVCNCRYVCFHPLSPPSLLY